MLVNELNTIPGFTATSVYARMLEADGIPFRSCSTGWCALALERHREERRYRY